MGFCRQSIVDAVFKKPRAWADSIDPNSTNVSDFVRQNRASIEAAKRRRRRLGRREQKCDWLCSSLATAPGAHPTSTQPEGGAHPAEPPVRRPLHEAPASAEPLRRSSPLAGPVHAHEWR